ncbi:universal stress protein A-like protein isoform X1 [Syzygium oleosum]|uniref:universal stress protein A-like protein isoform X1 n=1 Tax=Syzygium oleosum TaxID=219896 RepID=UPI0024B9AA31|nr:universal stress protein A-like protein isoform X1 [Syzygium oleosum]
MEEGGTKKKIMVAIDESECSHLALQWALDNLGHTIAGSELIVFSVQPSSDYGTVYAASYGAAPPDLIRILQENRKKLTSALLEKAKEICSQHGVNAETMTAVGDPKQEICTAVDELNIQFIVLGSHSRGAIKRAFLGSVSNYCVHNAKCPVLVVKKPA